MIRIKARNDKSNFKIILKASNAIEEINALPKTSPAYPAIAKIKIKKRYSFNEKLKKYINRKILIVC